ncbi:MAG: cation transporter [Bacillota bacterium]
MESLLLTVKGMSCAHCKMAVEKALMKLPGFISADADVSAGTVMVSYDGSRVSLDKIKETIADAGYEAL